MKPNHQSSFAEGLKEATNGIEKGRADMQLVFFHIQRRAFEKLLSDPNRSGHELWNKKENRTGVNKARLQATIENLCYCSR